MKAAVLTMNEGTMKKSSSSFGGVVFCAGVVLVVALATPVMAMADQFTAPTKEELAMKELPGYPGAPAVMLFHEQVTRDDMHAVQTYNRIKILTEKGKDQANVELSTFSRRPDSIFDESTDMTIDGIVGRTIHADGTIIPFTGKPYLKTIEKNATYVVQEKVFTLPDVEIGSIIEYRYARRYADHVYISPDWYIQGDLYLKSAHYMWYPTTRELSGEGGTVSTITVFPILPEGADFKRHDLPGGGITYELSVKDVPPQPKLDFMPPIQSFSFRVLFSYSPYHTATEYWQAQGKRWSKNADSFIGPNGDLKNDTQQVIAGAATPSEKLHKIYAAVMEMENTDYTRDRGKNEDKVAGMGKLNNAGDVFRRKRGNSLQLTYLFIGMARAAGLKAYAMQVPNRGRTIFLPQWLSMDEQFSNTIAIVNVDGKDVFFGPGERYLPYGRLQWNYSDVNGMRQTDGGGTAFALSPSMDYTHNHTARVCNLKMAADYSVTGSIKMTYEGAAALRWRQAAITGDEDSVHHDLETQVQEMVPSTLDVKFKSVSGLTEYEKPLLAEFEVKGHVGSPTGKRLVIPVDLFTVKERASFAPEKRDLPIYFHYPEFVQDALRIVLPANIAVEATPENAKMSLAGLALFDRTTTAEGVSVTVRRNFAIGSILVDKAKYGELRKFYSDFEAKDKDSVVLKVSAPVQAAANGGPGE